MSDKDTLRQKILASFLAVMMTVAIGAEIRSHSQSHHNFNGATGVETGQVLESKPTSSQRSFRNQFALINSSELVASRFYAPMHAPITWTR